MSSRDEPGDANKHKNINANTRGGLEGFPDLVGVGQNQSHVAAILGTGGRIARVEESKAECRLPNAE